MNTINLLKQPRPSLGHHMDMSNARPSPSITPREVLSAGAKSSPATLRCFRLKSRANVRSAVPAAMPTATRISAAAHSRELSDFRGDALVDGVLDLVRKHKPMHVSLVGGEPLVRHRELSTILPALSEMGFSRLVVTSGVIPIPEDG